MGPPAAGYAPVLLESVELFIGFQVSVLVGKSMLTWKFALFPVTVWRF